MHGAGIAALIAFGGLMAGPPVRAAPLRVVGSDLLGLEFSQALYRFAAPEGIELALALDGSRPGLDALRLGRADLGLIVLPDDEAPLAAEFDAMVLGYHHVVVLAPAACPLERITVPQLAAIFGAGMSPAITRWGELGLTGEWATPAIAPAAPGGGAGAGASLAVDYFRHAVLADRALRGNVERYAPGALAALFAGESRTLALAAGPLADSRAKILPVATAANAAAFLPTAENLHDGSYPLRLPLRAVYRRDALPKLRALLRYLCGDEAAAQLEHAGVAPLPAAARARQAFALTARPPEKT